MSVVPLGPVTETSDVGGLGLPTVAAAAVLLGLGALAAARPDVVSVDVNPLVVSNGRPIAVDALVEVET